MLLKIEQNNNSKDAILWHIESQIVLPTFFRCDFTTLALPVAFASIMTTQYSYFNIDYAENK